MEPSPLEMLSTLEAKSGTSIANEIYAFKDKGERNIALRFDLTIGLTRFVTARRDLKMPVKIGAFNGVWRYDEPQAGRYRYFHQWDIEIYGPFSQESDAEVIEFVSTFFKKLGMDSIIIDINSRKLVEEYIGVKLGISDKDLILEMFRAIDKVPKKGADQVIKEYDGKISSTALKNLIGLSLCKGTIQDVLSKADIQDLTSWKDLEGLMESLKFRGISNARINLGIVRGLDYYSGMVFEAFDPSLDMGALVGGGRYDTLTDTFGRKDMGAVGAAGGVERIILAMLKNNKLKKTEQPLVYVSYDSASVKNTVSAIVSRLRKEGFNTDFDLQGRAHRKQLEDAVAKGAVATIIVSSEKAEKNQVLVRWMSSGSEAYYHIEDLDKTFNNMLRTKRND
jgi:histidyl-tRNA synthetase